MTVQDDLAAALHSETDHPQPCLGANATDHEADAAAILAALPDRSNPEKLREALEAGESRWRRRGRQLDQAQATIEAMSGDAADLTDLIGEAAALRTALRHVLRRTHDTGCGTCDAARALLDADHELPSYREAKP